MIFLLRFEHVIGRNVSQVAKGSCFHSERIFAVDQGRHELGLLIRNMKFSWHESYNVG